MHEIKIKDIYRDFWKDEEMLYFSKCSAKLKFYDDPHKILVGKMKDETESVTIEELLGLKPKADLRLVNDNSEHK